MHNRYDHFRKALEKRGIREGELPFSPVAPVSTAYITYDAMQVWIGQQSPGKESDYIFIFLRSSAKEVHNNYEATNNFRKAAAGATECIIMVLGGTGNDRSAKYYFTSDTGSIGKLWIYIQNFEERLKKQGLQKDFPYTFTLTPDRENKGGKVYVFAVSHFYPGMPEAQRKAGSYLLREATGGNEEEDNYVELEATKGATCCQSPPRSLPK